MRFTACWPDALLRLSKEGGAWDMCMYVCIDAGSRREESRCGCYTWIIS